MRYSHPLYSRFNDMRQRAKKYGLECSFGLGIEEFNKWLAIIGFPPENMIFPTVGRYDHFKGYIFDTENNRWNFRWEEASENFSDGGKRGFISQYALGKNKFQTGEAQRISAALHKNRQTQKVNLTTGFKGVYERKRDNKYSASIQLNGKLTHLGYFSTTVEAAKAYDTAATNYFGEFAITNKTLGLY